MDGFRDDDGDREARDASNKLPARQEASKSSATARGAWPVPTTIRTLDVDRGAGTSRCDGGGGDGGALLPPLLLPPPPDGALRQSCTRGMAAAAAACCERGEVPVGRSGMAAAVSGTSLPGRRRLGVLVGRGTATLPGMPVGRGARGEGDGARAPD